MSIRARLICIYCKRMEQGMVSTYSIVISKDMHEYGHKYAIILILWIFKDSM